MSNAAALLPTILASTPSTALPVIPAPHLVPCSVAYDGPAEVSAYFGVDEGDDDTFTAHFRGRRLRGVRVRLPEGYAGRVWKSDGVGIGRANGQSTREKMVSVGSVLPNNDGQSSPRRSPRKHTVPQSAAQQPPKKRMKLADKMAAANAKKNRGSSVNAAVQVKSEESGASITLANEHINTDATDHKMAGAMPVETSDEFTGKQAKPEIVVDDEILTRQTTPPPFPSFVLPQVHSQPSTPKSILNTHEVPDVNDGERERTQRTLTPVAAFKDILLWHPDTLPDMGDDPYIASLKEWTLLASLIHA